MIGDSVSEKLCSHTTSGYSMQPVGERSICLMHGRFPHPNICFRGMTCPNIGSAKFPLSAVTPFGSLEEVSLR